MHYYKNLYLDKALRKKKDKIIQKLENGKLQVGISLIVLASGEQNQLEILDTLLFAQPAYPKKGLYVVGMAKGYDSALELVEKIILEVYETTGDADVKAYLQTTGTWI